VSILRRNLIGHAHTQRCNHGSCVRSTVIQSLATPGHTRQHRCCRSSMMPAAAAVGCCSCSASHRAHKTVVLPAGTSTHSLGLAHHRAISPPSLTLAALLHMFPARTAPTVAFTWCACALVQQLQYQKESLLPESFAAALHQRNEQAVCLAQLTTSMQQQLLMGFMVDPC
jgi:hypothetical protein